MQSIELLTVQSKTERRSFSVAPGPLGGEHFVACGIVNHRNLDPAGTLQCYRDTVTGINGRFVVPSSGSIIHLHFFARRSVLPARPDSSAKIAYVDRAGL